jgi:uncharacterized protein YbaR (Trm112 family)
MDPELLSLLVDPEDHGPLERATEAALEELRAAIAEGRARRRNGAPIGAFEGAFLARGRSVAYLIEDGVPNFVIDERVEIAGGLR